MKAPEGDALDDAHELWHSDSWDCPGGKPDVSVEQLAHALVVLERWFQHKPLPKPRLTPSRERVSVRQRPAKVDKGSQHSARRLVRERSGGLCEVCALAPAREWHHRKNRSQGGRWTAANGMDLCTADHAWITEHPVEAARNGWTVRSHEDPAAVPLLRRGKYVVFDDLGGVSAVEGEGAA